MAKTGRWDPDPALMDRSPSEMDSSKHFGSEDLAQERGLPSTLEVRPKGETTFRSGQDL